MSTLVRSSVVALAIATLAACAHSHTRAQSLSRRAAFDMQCPEDQLRAVKIDARSYGISGCGQRATYVETCEKTGPYERDRCTWVMNGAVSGSAPTPGPVSPAPEPVSPAPTNPAAPSP